MTIRYVTVDDHANIYEVTKLVDQFGRDTDDPQLASTCVVQDVAGHWVPFDVDDIPIYTVH